METGREEPMHWTKGGVKSLSKFFGGHVKKILHRPHFSSLILRCAEKGKVFLLIVLPSDKD